MNKYVTEALTELCKYVRVDFDALWAGMERGEDGRLQWPCDDYKWSSAAEHCFRGWLMERLKNKAFHRGLSGYCFSTAKKRRELIASMFILNYGWRSSDSHVRT